MDGPKGGGTMISQNKPWVARKLPKNGAQLFVAPRVLGGLKTTLSLATSNNIYIDCFVARKEVIWLLFYHAFYHHGKPIMHLGSDDHCLFSLSFLPLALMDTQISDASALVSECKVCLKSYIGWRALQRQETTASLPIVTRRQVISHGKKCKNRQKPCWYFSVGWSWYSMIERAL